MPIIDPYDGSEIDITTGNVTIIDPFDGKPIKIKKGTNNTKKENYKYSGPSENKSLVAAPESDYTLAKRIARKIAPATGTILRGGGQLFGGLAGLFAAPFAGPAAPAVPVAGGAAGFAGGDYLQYKLEEFGGTQPKRSIPQAAWDTTKAAGEGLLYEGLGAAALAAKPILGRAAKTMAGMGESSALSSAEKGAANKLRDLIGENNLKAYENNLAKAKEVQSRVNGFKPNLGQATNNPNVIQETQARVRKPQSALSGRTAAEAYKEAESMNNAALRKHLDETITGNQDDFIGTVANIKEGVEKGAFEAEKALNTKDPYTTGGRIVEEIGKAKKPIQKTMEELEGLVPRYPMEFTNTQKAIDSIRYNTKLSRPARDAAESFSNELTRSIEEGQHTHTAMGLNRTLNSLIERADESGNTAVKGALTKIKHEGVMADLDVISNMSRSGKIVQHEGKIINADRLASEYESNLKRIAEAKASTVPDIPTMEAELRAQKIPAMKQRGEGQAQYAERIGKDYKRITGGDIPVVSQEADIGHLVKRNEQIQKILSEASPGQDAGAALKAYNEFASKEYFGRFDNPTISRATAKGVNTENIPSYFKSETGALDLMRAVGPDKARDIMRDSLNHELSKLPTITGKELDKFLTRHNATLRRLGIRNEYKNLESATANLEYFNKSAAAKMIGADPDKIFKASLNGNSLARDARSMYELVKDNPQALKGLQKSFSDHVISAAETTRKDLAGSAVMTPGKAERVFEKYGSAMKEIFKDSPEKLKAMEDAREVVRIMSRDASPIFGGSPTASWMARMAEETAVNMAPAPVKYTMKIFKLYRTHMIDKYFQRALFDPDYAQTLLDGIQGKMKPKELSNKIREQMKMISRPVLASRREKDKNKGGAENEQN